MWDLIWRIAAIVVMGYLIGGVNGAILVSRYGMHDDVRKKGSGNAGLTNFIRNYGGWITLLVVFIDVGKAFLACFLARLILPDPEQAAFAKMLAGFSVQIGHIFPVYFGFRGGKGVLCSAGIALIMDWRVFAIAFPLFLIVFFTTRYVSLGSMVATATYGILLTIFFWDQPQVWVLALVMCAIVVYMHRGNIKRLIHGEERKTHFHRYKNVE